MNAQQALAAVRDEDNQINWAFFKPLKVKREDKLSVIQCGKGDMDEIREHLKTMDNEVAYGLYRYSRDKFMFLTWCVFKFGCIS